MDVAQQQTQATPSTDRLSSIGKYQLIARLGQGGMATVYLALVAGPGGFNKLLVVKVLREDLMEGSEEGVRMFWNEARLAAQLVHPNIVHTFEVGQVDTRCFIAMEYLDGQTLRIAQNRAAASGGIPINESLRILAEAARGLHYSHTLKSFKGEPLGVVHRDVSPQNIFITYDGQVKVLDFGIAKMRDSEFLTQVGVIKGKLEYVAPEQLRGEALDGRADVFALGAMLWEAVAGERFAGGRKVADVAKVHTRLSGGERRIRELKPETPDALVALIERAIAVDVDQRFPTAAALADAIDAYLERASVRPSGKTLSAFLEPLFEVERARMHRVIDQQIERSKQNAANGEQTADLPRIGADLSNTSGLLMGLPEGSSSGRSDLVMAVQAGNPAPPRKGKSPIMWIAVGAVIAAAASFAMLPSQREAEKPAALMPAPPAPNAAVAAVAPATAPEPAVAPLVPAAEQNDALSVLLDVKITPPDAQVLLDGAPLTMPFQGRFQKSASFHHIEAIAEGYRSYKRIIPFNQDQVLNIVLEAAPQHAGRRQARVAGADKHAEHAADVRTEPAVATTPAVQAKSANPDAPEPGVKIAPSGSGIKRRDLIVADPYAAP